MVLFDGMLKRISIIRNLADIKQCVAMPDNLKAGKFKKKKGGRDFVTPLSGKPWR
jgi:hypothetical protein